MSFSVICMLSKAEAEFLKSPENFSADYARVLRHRIKAKNARLRSELTLLDMSGPNGTENCNGVTEFCNVDENEKTLKQAHFGIGWWAEPDSDRRPLARKANVLTRLDDRPTRCLIKGQHWLILELCFLKWLFT